MNKFSAMAKARNKYGNHRVTAIDGTQCASKVECHMYELLKKFNIPFDFQVKYELTPKFRHGTTLYRESSLIVDFVVTEPIGTKWVIDTKGHQTEKSKLQWKVFLHKYVVDSPDKINVSLPRTKNDVFAVVITLKEIFDAQRRQDSSGTYSHLQI
jgi:hypothetical protein